MKVKLLIIISFVVVGFFLWKMTKKDSGLKKSPPLESASLAPSLTPGSAPPTSPLAPSVPLTHDEKPSIQKEEKLAGKDPLDGRKLTEEEFSSLITETAESIPTKADLRKLTDHEAHHMPASLQIAGEKLGQVAQAIANEPRLEPSAFSFYEKCVASSSFPDSIRALCFSNYKKLGKKLNVPINENLASPEIQDLEGKISNIE